MGSLLRPHADGSRNIFDMFQSATAPKERVGINEVPHHLEPHIIANMADPYPFKNPVDGHYYCIGTRQEGQYGKHLYFPMISAPSIRGLADAEKFDVKVYTQDPYSYEGWSPEIYYYPLDQVYIMYLATSCGMNHSHMMHLYSSYDIRGPYGYLMPMSEKEGGWAIDMTRFRGSDGRYYASWSGWEYGDDRQQDIYLGLMNTPYSIYNKVRIASPEYPWMRSRKPVLEGPQALYLDGKFAGLSCAADFGLFPEYNTAIIWYVGGPMTDTASWTLDPLPVFPRGYGLGHGVFIEEDRDSQTVAFISNYKKKKIVGWEDRQAIMMTIPKEVLRMRRRQVLTYHAGEGDISERLYRHALSHPERYLVPFTVQDRARWTLQEKVSPRFTKFRTV